jgi:hypothetical protein
VITSQDRASFDYRTSDDGGRTWEAVTVALPRKHTINEIDLRAHRAAGVAAVAMRAHDAATGTDQDLVYKLDITRAGPRLVRLCEVGLGDVGAVAGVGNAIRFDFESVTVFADGRVGCRSWTRPRRCIIPFTAPKVPLRRWRSNSPALWEKRFPHHPEEVAPVLGKAYESYTFDQSEEGWTTSGIPHLVPRRTWKQVRSGRPVHGKLRDRGPGPLRGQHECLADVAADPTDAGQTVLEFWLKADIEDGFDFLRAEWRADGLELGAGSQYTGQSEGYPD